MVLGIDEEPVDTNRKWKLGGALLGLSLIGVVGVQTTLKSKNNKTMSAKAEFPFGNDKVQATNDRASFPFGNDRVEFPFGNDKVDTKEDTTTTQKPNIFLFTVDDLGWNDISYNSGDLPEATPYMRKISEQGIILTHYYSQPSCTPSRVSMMTGKFPYRNGFQNYELQFNDAVGVPLSNKMMPEHMKELGYKTIGFGKWNIGHCNEKYLPTSRGFDRYLGYLCPGHGYRDFNCGMGAGYKDMIEGWAVSEVNANHRWEAGSQYEGTYDTEIYRTESTISIEKHFNTHDDVPLFMWIAHHGIHSEFDSEPIPPEIMLTAENKAYLKVLRKHLDETGSADEGWSQFFKMRMITATVLMSIDNSLERLVTTLEGFDQLSNSVILVNSDNGGDTFYTKGHPGNNYPLRSEKFSYFEGGIRVPAFVFAPGLITGTMQGTKYHGLIHHVDLVSTFYYLGGGDTDILESKHPDLDSMNQWNAIIGDTTSPRTELVLNLPRSKTWKVGENETSEGVIIRMGNYKLMLNHAYDSWFSPSPGEYFQTTVKMMASKCEYNFYDTSSNPNCVFNNYLFDIINDPTEQTNIFGHHDYKAVGEHMISRAKELVAGQHTEYGKLIPEYYEKALYDGKTNDTYTAAFKAHDDYIVPWGCEAIP